MQKKKVQSYFEDLHFKCVKYQDMHCIMVSIVSNVLREMRSVEQHALDEFVQVNKLRKGQITLEKD